MTDKISLGSELRHLLSNLSDHGGQHLTEIETDLVQTNFLLSEAIEKLSASFMAIHAAVSAQQQAVEALLASVNPETSTSLKEHHAEIERHVSSAVTGLQFQDMTSQLIGRTVRRVVGLRDVLNGVGAGASAIPAENKPEEVISTLSTINQAMEKQSVQLEGELWKAVCQTHMESGDIELF